MNDLKVNNPMKKFPLYALSEKATADEMRDAAVRAMKDGITVKWKAPGFFILDKYMTDESARFLRYNTDKVYSGLPYTNGNTGILTWLEFYNPEDGSMTVDMPTLLYQLGNACFIAVMLAWSAVHPHWDLYAAPNTFFYDDVVKVGPYELFREKWVEKADYDTTFICEQNGEQMLYESYAALRGADAISYRRADDDHTAMAAKAPNVVRNPDGTINGEKSTLVIMEQSMDFRPADEDGQKVCYFGSTDKVVTFAHLWKEQFIPYTLKQFTGEKSYEKAELRIDKAENGEVKNFSDLNKCLILSNYKIISLTSIVSEKDGTECGRYKVVLTYAHNATNTCFKYPGKGVPQLDFIDFDFVPGKEYRFDLAVRVGTGEVFHPITFDFTAKE